MDPFEMDNYYSNKFNPDGSRHVDLENLAQFEGRILLKVTIDELEPFYSVYWHKSGAKGEASVERDTEDEIREVFKNAKI